MHEASRGPLKSTMSAEKPFKGPRQRRGSFWEELQRIVFSQLGVIDFPSRQINDFCYKKETENRIEVVTRPEDNQKRKTEALALYQEGVEMLIQATKTIKDNPNTVLAYKKKAQEAITRAEQLKMQINQDKKEGKFHEQVL